MPRKKQEGKSSAPVAGLWSGTISFGLVSVPVALYPALRGRPVRMRMLTKDGRPLKRRYFCPDHEKELGPKEIVRGYEMEGKFVTVEDDELNALEPRKSSDIELKQFVPAREIPPHLFDRPYFLAPTGRSTKAYRLLVRSMGKKSMAGIATFVMQGKEHLVAILAENGLLMVETLRYQDELRSADRIGLPEASAADKEMAKAFSRVIAGLKKIELSGETLEDRYAGRFRELLQRKKRIQKAVVKVREAEEPEEEEGGKVIDFVAIFKERLAAKEKQRRARDAG